MEREARLFAFAAHRSIGQRRKYTNECYTMHLQEVVNILRSVNADDVTLAIGWLHDVVEDTGITLVDVLSCFGTTIADGVYYCTEISKPEDGNRAARKRIDAEHFSQGGSKSQTVKVADIISNVSSITEHDIEFAKVYVYEKEHQLSLLTKANKELISWATKIINDAKETIENGI